MPNGTCWCCYAREEPDASQVFVGKVLLQRRARNTGLSIFLVYSSAAAHHPANVVLASAAPAVPASADSPRTPAVLPMAFSCDRGPCSSSLGLLLSPRQGSSQEMALPFLVGKASAPSILPGCVPLLIQAQPVQDQLEEGNAFPQLHAVMGQLLTADTFPQGL